VPRVEPAVLDEWLQLALENNPKTLRARHELTVARREVERRRLGTRPSLDLVGAAGRDVNPTVQFFGTRVNSAQVGLAFSWPIWDGGAIDAGVREAIRLGERAAADVEAAEREAEYEVRRLFRRLGSGLAMLSALRNAERSAETTLRSTQRAWEVGVRVNQDVLDAQQQWFATRRDLARARYEFIADTLRLRRAAGVLEDADIERLSALLDEPVDPFMR
jgi:outer membrane protein